MPIRTSPLTFFASASLVAAGLAVATLCWHIQPVSAHGATPDPASVEFFTQNVQPILKGNCYRCHGGINHRGGLSLDTKAGMMKGGKDGVVLSPGHPEDSLLIKLIRHEGPADDPMPMPPKSKLSDADIATVTAWVKAGALMPE